MSLDLDEILVSFAELVEQYGQAAGEEADEDSDNFRCIDCVGCRSCRFCTACHGCTECTYCDASVDSKRCTQGRELLACVDCSHSTHSAYCEQSAYVVLSYECRKCIHCFGCVGLTGQEFCILNEKYSRRDYFEAVARLKAALDAKSLNGWSPPWFEANDSEDHSSAAYSDEHRAPGSLFDVGPVEEDGGHASEDEDPGEGGLRGPPEDPKGSREERPPNVDSDTDSTANLRGRAGRLESWPSALAPPPWNSEGDEPTRLTPLPFPDLEDDPLFAEFDGFAFTAAEEDLHRQDRWESNPQPSDRPPARTETSGGETVRSSAPPLRPEQLEAEPGFIDLRPAKGSHAPSKVAAPSRTSSNQDSGKVKDDASRLERWAAASKPSDLGARWRTTDSAESIVNAERTRATELVDRVSAASPSTPRAPTDARSAGTLRSARRPPRKDGG